MSKVGFNPHARLVDIKFLLNQQSTGKVPQQILKLIVLMKLNIGPVWIAIILIFIFFTKNIKLKM